MLAFRLLEFNFAGERIATGAGTGRGDEIELVDGGCEASDVQLGTISRPVDISFFFSRSRYIRQPTFTHSERIARN